MKPGLDPVYDQPLAWIKFYGPDGKAFHEIALGNSNHQIINMLRHIAHNMELAQTHKAEGYAAGALSRIAKEAP